MKIALFYNLNFGGAKRAVFEHVKRLQERGHLVEVYTTDGMRDAFDISGIAGNYHYYNYSEIKSNIPIISRFLNDIKTFLFLNILHKKIAKEIDKKRYDIVLVHPDKMTQAPFLLRHLKTKSIYYCQEPLRISYEYVLHPDRNIGIIKYLYELLTRSIRKRIDVENVRSADFTIASCYHIRERMIESYGVYPRVSYLGIDTKTFRPMDIKKKNQVFFVGNKDVWNDGYDLAEKALSLIPAGKRPKLKIVSWVNENNERMSDEELVREYNESLATLCLSRFETFGLVPLESIACGTEVIATRVNGHRETVREDLGNFVELDPSEIADKITKIRKSNLQSLRTYAVQNWDWDVKIIDFENLLIRLSESKSDVV